MLSDFPRIFRVNWFRRDEKGTFLWPGFGENMRVLKWVFDRIHGCGNSVESPIGFMPRHQDIHWDGLEYDPELFYRIMSVDHEQIKRELNAHEELFDNFYDRLPKEFIYHKELMKSRLWRSPKVWEMPRQVF